MAQLNARLLRLLDKALEAEGPLVVLTGAGVSAESGVPTFRGVDGYWQVGSKNYHPQELATRSAFGEMPTEVWAWYLYRRSMCRAAGPNPAHRALAQLETSLRDRFVLVTQNVDGLHLRAGSSAERTYEIHGNIDFMRFELEGFRTPVLIPEGIDLEWPKGRSLTVEEQTLLTHESSGVLARPHVLWFDEFYDEELFRFESSMKVTLEASALLIVGTSGSTTLPVNMAAVALKRNIPLIVINLDGETAFAEFAEAASNGCLELGSAATLVPAIADYVAKRSS